MINRHNYAYLWATIAGGLASRKGADDLDLIASQTEALIDKFEKCDKRRFAKEDAAYADHAKGENR